MFEEYMDHDIAAYAGYVLSEKELMNCSSGGIATALAKKAIQLGGYVVGVAYSEDFYSARYEIINEEEDLYRLQGSKYVETDKNNIYNKVKDLLEDGNLVLFFGLPCIVAAMRRFLKKEYPSFLAVEMICHGQTPKAVHIQYIQYLENQYRSKVTDFSVRKKCCGWMPAYLYAKFSNEKVFQEEFYRTDYGYAFSIMSMHSCYTCRFKGNNRQGDIMLGDFWGTNEEDEFWNPGGVSAILVHTEKGKNFLCSIDNIKLFPTTFERIVSHNLCVIKSNTPYGNLRKFETMFAQKGLLYAVRHSIGRKSWIKLMIQHARIALIKYGLPYN